MSQKVAASVVENLGRLKDAFRSKYMANIISNIELAASYLGIMTMVRFSSLLFPVITNILSVQGVIDVPVDTDFPVRLQECLQKAGYVGFPSITPAYLGV